MDYTVTGKIESPALVCIPGLMGGPENFLDYIPTLTKSFFVIVVDPNAERRDQSLSKMTESIINEVTYNTSARDILQILEQNGKTEAYFFGVSLGGKILYDFASKFPNAFLGGVLTDVSPGPFENSDIYRLVEQLVKETNLDLTWPKLKEDLALKIPDRSLRTLIQTQISYPSGHPPAVWKVGMRNFGAMLKRQSISDQFAELEAASPNLKSKGKAIHVLHSETLSGISADDLIRLRNISCVEIFEVPKTSHFLHVTHKDVVLRMVMAIKKNTVGETRLTASEDTMKL